ALGASGAIETAFAALALRDGWVPGSLNCENPVTEGGLTFLPPGGVTGRPATVLKQSFGFGGTNAALVLARD
ncbi:MAG: beta-ketoacyl-ACP synthase II, partial [Gemmatimonadetes bacterium]|nr:beta-ketoacyl-ACP synthase II [Gemmatimonadota bacterium]